MGVSHEVSSAAAVLALLEDRARLVRDGASLEELPDAAELLHLDPLFQVLLRHSFDGIALNARGSRWLLEVSDSFVALTGFERSELLGRTSEEVGLVIREGVHEEAAQHADRGEGGLYEGTIRRKDGTRRSVEFSHQLLGSDYVLTVVRDVTARRRLEDELRTLADSDPLTGVLNTRRFREEVERALLEARRFGDPVSLVVVDVDRFKEINDTHGHEVGDACLAAVTSALLATARETDVVGRLGGDEFCVLLRRPAKGATERVVAAFHALLAQYEGTLPLLRASAGVAHALPDELDASALIGRADAAMYASKRARSS